MSENQNDIEKALQWFEQQVSDAEGREMAAVIREGVGEAEKAIAEALCLVAEVYQWVGAIEPEACPKSPDWEAVMDALSTLEMRFGHLITAEAMERAMEKDAIERAREWLEQRKEQEEHDDGK